MELTSAAFAEGEGIPAKHTCDGDDVSPPLAWDAPPADTVALALCLDDPDAGRYPFTHWLAWSLPAEAGALGEGDAAPAEGRNDFGAPGYRGPCPPPGKPHRYVFTLYALDVPKLPLPEKFGKYEVLAAMKGRLLADASITGLFTLNANVKK